MYRVGLVFIIWFVVRIVAVLVVLGRHDDDYFFEYYGGPQDEE